MNRRYVSTVSTLMFWLALTYLAVTVFWLGVGTSAAFADEADLAVAASAESDDGLFMHIVRSAGPLFGGVLLLLSISLVALIVMLALDLRMMVAIPPPFVAQFTEHVNQRKFKEAFELSRSNPSFLARVLTAGMARLQYGLEDSREAAMNTLDSIKSSKDQLNNYVAVIGSLGPLIGLVGTVFGMILSFKELARGGKVDASRLAGGISHALVITMLGIGLAVPAVFFNAFFRNRISRLATDTSNLADDLLTNMFHNSKKPPVSTPTAATVVAQPTAKPPA